MFSVVILTDARVKSGRQATDNGRDPHHGPARRFEEELRTVGEDGETADDTYISPWDAPEYWYGANPYDDNNVNQYSYNYEFDGSYDTHGEHVTISRFLHSPTGLHHESHRVRAQASLPLMVVCLDVMISGLAMESVTRHATWQAASMTTLTVPPAKVRRASCPPLFCTPIAMGIDSNKVWFAVCAPQILVNATRRLMAATTEASWRRQRADSFVSFGLISGHTHMCAHTQTIRARVSAGTTHAATLMATRGRGASR